MDIICVRPKRFPKEISDSSAAWCWAKLRDNACTRLFRWHKMRIRTHQASRYWCAVYDHEKTASPVVADPEQYPHSRHNSDPYNSPHCTSDRQAGQVHSSAASTQQMKVITTEDESVTNFIGIFGCTTSCWRSNQCVYIYKASCFCFGLQLSNLCTIKSGLATEISRLA